MSPLPPPADRPARGGSAAAAGMASRGPSPRSEHRFSTGNPDAADCYRAAAEAACTAPVTALAFLERALAFDPAFVLAGCDLAVLQGRQIPSLRGRPPGTRWERQQLEIIQAVQDDDLDRAEVLLHEHAVEFERDALALLALLKRRPQLSGSAEPQTPCSVPTAGPP